MSALIEIMKMVEAHIDSQNLTARMQTSLANFFKEHQVHEVLPDNAKVVVLNHDLSIKQCINAMVLDQNVQWTAVWDSGKKEFLGIITIRDLLEMLVYFVESLKESFLCVETQLMTETPFISFFLERYLMVLPSQLMSTDQQIKGRLKSLRQLDQEQNAD